MARVKDLWFTARTRQKTARHPDHGGNPKAKRWLAEWAGPDGKPHGRAFRKQSDAAKFARKMEADLERGEYIDPSAGKVLVGAVAAKWLRLRGVGAASRTRYEGVWRQHVAPVFGQRSVRSVRPSEIMEWSSDLGAGTVTQQIARIILAGVFDLAVADGMRRDNPVRSPVVPRLRQEPPLERDPWPTERIWAVIDAHPGCYRAIPVAAAGLGLRQGCALALALDDFDFEAGTVRICRQLAPAGKTLTFKAPKGGRQRVVPLPRGVAEAILAHSAAYEPEPATLPWMQENGELGAEPYTCRLLFRWASDQLRTQGAPIRATWYNRMVWKPALARTGVIPAAGTDASGRMRYAPARQDGMHALRHWYASAMLDAGVSLAGIMEFMGHSRKGKPVTLGVYGHVTPETFQQARDAIDQSLFRLRPIRSIGTRTERRASR